MLPHYTGHGVYDARIDPVANVPVVAWLYRVSATDDTLIGVRYIASCPTLALAESLVRVLEIDACRAQRLTAHMSTPELS